MSRRAQDGAILLIALVMLVALGLAGAAIMRSATGGILVAGNLAFKQAATSAADYGVELGRRWLERNPTRLKDDISAEGYFASWDDAFDPTAFDWGAKSGPTGTDAYSGTRGQIDAQGHDVRFVIHRLCDATMRTKDPDAVHCAMANGGGGASTMRNAHYQDRALAGVNAVYYRITARVVGARGTTSFVQSIIQL